MHPIEEKHITVSNIEWTKIIKIDKVQQEKRASKQPEKTEQTNKQENKQTKP